MVLLIGKNEYESIIQKELHVLQRDNRNERQSERQLVSVQYGRDITRLQESITNRDKKGRD